jgi:hypothetical protein
MRIKFERSGGMAGMRLATSLNTKYLEADEAQKLEKLVEDCNFFDLPEKMTSSRGGADRFQYKITVSSGWKKHTLVADESELPKKLQSLVKQLTTLARRKAA